MASPGLWSLNHPASNFDVFYCVNRAAQISTAAVAWNPANPLRRINDGTFGLQYSSLAISAVEVPTNIDINMRAIGTVLRRASHGTATQPTVASITRTVTTTLIIMPCCRLVATAIVLCPIKLCTATTLAVVVAATVAVAIDPTVFVVWVGDVEVVIHSIVGAAQIHIPRHTTAREIK